jgi:hypothetical protein
MISDREPFVQERDSGRLEEYGANDGILLLSETIFGPAIEGRRADKDKSRQLPAQPELDYEWWSWRVGAWHTHCNWKTFGELFASGMNIFIPMLQAAVIMGAKKIGVVGVDMQWPKKGPSHHFGDGKAVGASPFPGLKMILHLFKRAKKQLDKMGVKVYNLSPVKNTPFASVFGRTEIEEFLG